MKTYQPIVSVVFLALLIGCQPPAETPDEISNDLPSLRAAIKEKKSAYNALGKEIEELQERADKLDPNKEVSRSLVTVAPVEQKDFKHYVTVQGNVASDDIVNASSEVGGRIIALKVDEGNYVKKGALLAKIDLESVEKQIAEVEKSLELAKEVFERQSRLWEQKIGSEIQYLQAKNNKERLEKTLETLDFQLTKANVYAPISGAVDVVYLKDGELAAPGAPIVQLLSTSRLKVEADAPEDLLRSIKRGDQVSVYFPALDERQEVRINMLGRRIDPANRTFEIETSLSNRSGLIKPNLLAEIRINDYTEEEVIIVPLELVQQEVGGKDFVMVKGGTEQEPMAQKVYVETGDSYEGNIVIKSGLNVGDQIITVGARGLTHSEPIKVTT
ncbi:MAG: efflux RND transporter periplasmic adaptor subunit [Saprospiraceae bacterium]|nr:efflux RND transporter periplasmic adaptor subunit [Saprospiraceae bacterium]